MISVVAIFVITINNFYLMSIKFYLAWLIISEFSTNR